MKLHLNVTREDINVGNIRNGESCPIAIAARRAVKELFPNEVHIETEMDDILRICIGYDVYRICDERLNDFVDEYDNHQYVEPFEGDFELKKYEYDGD